MFKLRLFQSHNRLTQPAIDLVKPWRVASSYWKCYDSSLFHLNCFKPAELEIEEIVESSKYKCTESDSTITALRQ